MINFSKVRPNQRRVKAEMDAWAKGRKTNALKIVTVSPVKSRQISKRMASMMMVTDGPLISADD